MPFRLLLYIADEYKKIVNVKKRYALSLQKIPLPDFFVLYNGLKEQPLRTTLKLSDAFDTKRKQSPLELIVHVININANKNTDLLNRCPYLKEYSLFVEEVRKQQAIDKKNGYTKAVKYCIENNILEEYLKRNSKEIKNMLIAEYDYATDVAVQRKEAARIAFADGEQHGRQEGIYQTKLETAKAFKQMGLPLDQIAKGTGLSVKEIEEL